MNMTKDESLSTWGGKDETTPIQLQDSRTRDETKNNLSQPNDPSQSQEPFDLSNTNVEQDTNKPAAESKIMKKGNTVKEINDDKAY